LGAETEMVTGNQSSTEWLSVWLPGKEVGDRQRALLGACVIGGLHARLELGSPSPAGDS
jgi:hypothetical protein